MIFYGKTFREKQIEAKGRAYDDDVRRLREEVNRLKALIAPKETK